MRRVALLLCLALIAAACGDDDAGTTTTGATDQATTPSSGATTSSTEAAPTTEAGPQTAALLCVIGRGPGEFADIRNEPDAGAGLVSQLPADATGIQATGNTSGDWTEIIWDGATSWVESYFLTPSHCEPGAGAVTYAVNDISCEGSLNIRDGVSEDHDVLGSFEATDFNIPGTGVTALDAEGREWVQIVFNDRNAWVAGWFMTTDPGPTIECGPALPWLMTADSLGPIELGAQASDLEPLTGMTWELNDANNDCTWYLNPSGDVGVQAQNGVIVEIWAMSAEVAVTPEGFAVGQTKSDAGSAFFGRAVILEGPFGGQVIVIDTATWQENFTYLLIEESIDSDVIGTIRINDDGGYITGGCA